MQRRSLGLGLTAIMLTGILLSGCGGSNSTSKDKLQPNREAAGRNSTNKTNIKFWGAAITPEREAFWQRVAKDFMAKNPDITVTFLGVPGDLSAYIEMLNVSIAAGQAPDLINYFTSDFVNRGVLEPLDSYFDNWDGKGKITPAAIASMRSTDPKGGKLYGLPYGVLPWIGWVRSDWLKAANLPVPETWDQFFDDAQKLTDRSKNHYGYSIRGGAGSASTLEMLMYSYSGITEYFTKDGKATINDPLHIQFLEKYLGGYDVNTPEDDLSKGWTELAASFQAGQVGMIFHNLGSGSAHGKAFNGDYSKFAALPFPKSLKGYTVQAGVTPSVFNLLKSSKNKDAAWKFMTFFVMNDNSEYGKLYGEIPANLDVLKDDWIQKTPYIKIGADIMESSETQFTNNPVYLPGYNNVQRNMEPLIQRVMAKKMSAKELLDEWAKQLEKEKAAFDSKR